MGTDPTAPNVVPSRYRQVSVASVPSLERGWLAEHFTEREVYFRTRYVVARGPGGHALVEVDRADSDELFVDTVGARVLAGPEECAYVADETIDTAIPSRLAAAADRAPDARCVVVEGLYSHVSFILNPAPVRLRVVDVVPPGPAKLVDQVARVLSLAEDLPPVVAEPDVVDLRGLLPEPPPAQVLLPCRASGVELPASEVSFLDERPEAKDWTMLGCERSDQIHRWFYGMAPRRLDTCPRQWLSPDGATVTLTRCCLLQEGLEVVGRNVVVPWGASLAEVRRALDEVARVSEVEWTAT
jgi:hypothetical protein